MVNWLAGFMLSLMLMGCNPFSTPQAKNDPHAIRQAEMEKGSPDFSQVLSIRLKSEGKRVEVTSVLPAVIAEATLSGQPMKTIFRVNDTKDGLVLFSRDLLKESSYRTEIKLSELESKHGVMFAVVQADGNLKDQWFELERVIRPNL